ncbi:MAG: AAA family ATPase [Chromatiales bacterium]|jgi:chromosome partitioning protein
MITVVGSLKGGSGKSTVTFNLAVWLSMAGQNVLAIDVDPQATLSDVAEVRNEERYEPGIRVKGKTALREELMQDADEVLIDIGTADIESMKKAISLADRIVVPVPPSQADIWSTQRFIRFVASVRGAESMPPMMGFINRADTHQAVRESDEAAAALVSLQHIHFLRPRLCQRTVFRRSFSEGLAVFELDPRSKGTREWNSLAALLYPELVSG